MPSHACCALYGMTSALEYGKLRMVVYRTMGYYCARCLVQAYFAIINTVNEYLLLVRSVRTVRRGNR